MFNCLHLPLPRIAHQIEQPDPPLLSVLFLILDALHIRHVTVDCVTHHQRVGIDTNAQPANLFGLCNGWGDL